VCLVACLVVRTRYVVANGRVRVVVYLLSQAGARGCHGGHGVNRAIRAVVIAGLVLRTSGLSSADYLRWCVSGYLCVRYGLCACCTFLFVVWILCAHLVGGGDVGTYPLEVHSLHGFGVGTGFVRTLLKGPSFWSHILY